MPEPDPSDPKASRSFDQRLDDLRASQVRPASGLAAAEGATGAAYRIIAELFGGVLVGLGLGFAVDRVARVTAPWGLIGGVLVGFAVSLWMAKQTADRLTAQAAAGQATAGRPPPRALPDDEDDDA